MSLVWPTDGRGSCCLWQRAIKRFGEPLAAASQELNSCVLHQRWGRKLAKYNLIGVLTKWNVAGMHILKPYFLWVATRVAAIFPADLACAICTQTHIWVEVWSDTSPNPIPLPTHPSLDKMATISQTIFSDACSWMIFCILIKISLKFVP